jgi:hypothetical protein
VIAASGGCLHRSESTFLKQLTFLKIRGRNLGAADGFMYTERDPGGGVVESEEVGMKRMIAGVLFVMALGAGTMFADDGYKHERRDIRRDEAKIAHDRRELRRDLYYGNYAAARHERRELRREYRDLNRDRRELYWDRR